MQLKYLTREPIDAGEVLKTAGKNDFGGACVTFFGTIRDNPFGKRVQKLEYEAYEPLAEKTIDELVGKAFRIWPALEISVLHRLGTLRVGEIAVAIAVQSAHRDEAYKVSRFLIDEIKRRAPIWKKEYFTDGTHEWGACAHHGAGQDAITSPLRFVRFDGGGETAAAAAVPRGRAGEPDREREQISELLMDGVADYD